MNKDKPFVLEFAIKVLLPSLIAASVISLFLYNIFIGVVERSDFQSEEQSQRAALSAVEHLGDNLKSLVRREARRELTVSNASGAGNPDWLRELWRAGQETETQINTYDAIFLVDAQNNTLLSALPGQQTGTKIEDYLGPDNLDILSQLPQEGGQSDGVSAFLENGGTIHLVSAAVIARPDQAAPDLPHRLVFAKKFDGAVLSMISKHFALPDLHIESKAGGTGASLQIVSPGNQPLARLVWANSRQGGALQQEFGNQVWMALFLFNTVTCLLIYVSWLGFRDASESKIAAINASERDALTGLPNRRKLMQVLGERLAATRADHGNLSVVYTDLDGFKEVNDSFGHEAGDVLLKIVATGFDSLSAGKDLLSRLGGDEFAVVVSGPESARHSRDIAQRMISFLEKPIDIGGRLASVSVSAGIVNVEPGAAEITEVLRRADLAMYAAKSAGRNRVRVYDEGLDKERNKRRNMAGMLRTAIDNKTLRIMYQPIVDANSQQTTGLEALARWPREVVPSYNPDEFIPVAEEFGLIEDLGKYVLLEACKQAVQWRGLYLAVNVSSFQLANPLFSTMVKDTLTLTGLAPERLEIEVTESFVFANTENAVTNINHLREMKISIALDDFGTGYSSISHLRQFKFDKLKLDRSMVEGIPGEAAALRLVMGTIAMADALGIRVTAEGIEHQSQLLVLRQSGCDEFQGYFFSRPVEAADIHKTLGLGALAGTA